MSHYSQLLAKSGLARVPTYFRIAIEGIWRAVPYLDMPSFAESTKQNGLPHVERELIMFPTGDGYDGLAPLVWNDDDQDSGPDLVGISQALAVFDTVLTIMGIDGRYVAEHAEEFLDAIKRRIKNAGSA